jgi:uncharacterized membrane protein
VVSVLRLVDLGTAIPHVLVGAAWFGAMIYSHFVLYPRARAFFERDEDFEGILVAMAHGARWKVIAALGAIAATGAVLLWTRREHAGSPGWTAVIFAKCVVFLAAATLFAIVSWKLWPARVFASPKDLPRIRRLFRAVAFTMLALASTSLALGVLAHAL